MRRIKLERHEQAVKPHGLRDRIMRPVLGMEREHPPDQDQHPRPDVVPDQRSRPSLGVRELYQATEREQQPHDEVLPLLRILRQIGQPDRQPSQPVVEEQEEDEEHAEDRHQSRPGDPQAARSVQEGLVQCEDRGDRHHDPDDPMRQVRSLP